MCSISQNSDSTYMRRTKRRGSVLIFCNFKNLHLKFTFKITSLNIKFDVNRTFHVLKIPLYRLGLYGRYQILYLFAKFEVCSSLRSDTIVITTDGQTDIAQMSQNFALIKCHHGTQGLRSIFISSCSTRTDKTNIPSMRRVRKNLKSN